MTPVELAFQNSGAGAPSWIQVFPKGPELKTSDGRKFRLSDPDGFAKKLNASQKPIVIDYDHLSHFEPDGGGSQKAAGWMTRFEARDGSLWALAEWTPSASQKIIDREYRYFSPEFFPDPRTGEIVDLIAAGLVNRPAFDLVALAAAKKNTPEKTKEVNMYNAIAKELGLSDDADEAAILAAMRKSKNDHAAELASAKAQASAPSVEKFMPRADYDAVLARAETAEKKVKEAETAAFAEKVDVALTQAIKEKKITPGSKGHYASLCTTQDALDGVMKAIGAAPEVIEGSEIKGKPDEGKISLTSEEQSVATSLGISEEDFATHKREQTA